MVLAWFVQKDLKQSVGTAHQKEIAIVFLGFMALQEDLALNVCMDLIALEARLHFHVH